MTLNEYQELASRTMNDALSDSETQLHALFGMASEVGELHAIYQKFYQGHEVEREHCLKELGDLMWFVSEYALTLGVTLEMVAQMNIEKLKARYPEGFREKDSLVRAEGDI